MSTKSRFPDSSVMSWLSDIAKYKLELKDSTPGSESAYCSEKVISGGENATLLRTAMSFNPPPRNDQRPDQNSLLRFGIENAAPGAILQIGEDVKAGRRPDLNSAMLKHIMGVSPADRMVECVGVIDGRWIDPETGKDLSSDITLEDKLVAWDDLEMVSPSHRVPASFEERRARFTKSRNKPQILISLPWACSSSRTSTTPVVCRRNMLCYYTC